MDTIKTFPGYQTKELTDSIKKKIIIMVKDKYMDDLHQLYYDFRDYFANRFTFYAFIDSHVINKFTVSTGVMQGMNPAYDSDPNMVTSPNGVMCDAYWIKAPSKSKIVYIAHDGCDDHLPHDFKAPILRGRHAGSMAYMKRGGDDA